MEPPSPHLPTRWPSPIVDGRRLGIQPEALTAPATPARAAESGKRARAARSVEGTQPWGHALAIGAATGAVIMAVTSTGDVIFLGVLLGLAAVDVFAGSVGILAAAGVIGRWGTSSLAALAGGQAVVGAAGWTGSTAMVASSWGGAAALILVCPPGLAPAAAFGVTAAQLVAGPALAEGSSAGTVALRVLTPIAGMGVALVVARVVPRPIARTVAVIVAGAAAALAFAT